MVTCSSSFLCCDFLVVCQTLCVKELQRLWSCKSFFPLTIIVWAEWIWFVTEMIVGFGKVWLDSCSLSSLASDTCRADWEFSPFEHWESSVLTDCGRVLSVLQSASSWGHWEVNLCFWTCPGVLSIVSPLPCCLAPRLRAAARIFWHVCSDSTAPHPWGCPVGWRLPG